MAFLKNLAIGTLAALGTVAAAFFLGRKVEKAENRADTAVAVLKNKTGQQEAADQSPKTDEAAWDSLEAGNEPVGGK